MRIAEYLSGNGLTYTAFGRLIGTSAEAVRRYANAERLPHARIMAAIIRETGGHVQPNDFFVGTAHDTAPKARPKRKRAA